MIEAAQLSDGQNPYRSADSDTSANGDNLRSLVIANPNHADAALFVKKKLVLLLTLNAIINAFCLYEAWHSAPYFALLNLLSTSAVIVVCTQMGRRRELRNLSRVCIFFGLLWPAQWLTTRNYGIFPLLGAETNQWIYAIGAIGMLRTPADVQRIRNRSIERLFLLTAAAQNMIILFSKPEWMGYQPSVFWPHIEESRQIFSISFHCASVAWAVLSVAFCICMARRLRSLTTVDRVAACPVVVGICTVGLAAGLSSVKFPFPPPRIDIYMVVLTSMLFTAPIGICTASLVRLVHNALLTERFSRQLSRRVVTGDVLRQEFRNVFEDESIDILYWYADRYVDSNGMVPNYKPSESIKTIARISDNGGEPLAIVIGKQPILDHTSLFDSFLGASAIALKNVQLQASVQSQLEQLKASRSRIVEATFEERRRIERDLHDGIQQRLLAIQARIGIFKRSASQLEKSRLEVLASEIGTTVSSLRNLARGINPPELSQFGLRGAIDSMSEQLPIELITNIDTRRYSPMIESTLYFVIAEALSNVIKHSAATRVCVDLEDRDDCLTLRIEDNGNGGARRSPGGGLDGMADRLRSIGGSLDVETSALSGSRLTSTINLRSTNAALHE